jgi:3-hydroxyacyl-CoA dehydrogenase
MLAIRRREAEAMILEGAAPDRIDRVVEEFGFRMGPFRMGDLAGLDLGWTPDNSTGSTVRERLCEAGRRGQKTGAGFYDYDEQRRPMISPQAMDIIAGFARDKGIVSRELSDAAILDRMVLPMIDEAARILAEGIAARESDIDVVWIHGYGWPRHTGGPMRHARAVGLETICARLSAMGHPPSSRLLEMSKAPA